MRNKLIFPIIFLCVLFVSACQKRGVQSSDLPPADKDVVTGHIEEVEVPTDVVNETYFEYDRRLKESPKFPEFNEGIVSLEKIVNLGLQVWKIVESGKAVSKTTELFANALPSGTKALADLENFSEPQYRSYRIYGTNLYGATVYDITYTLIHRYGGTYDSKGAYLENVSIVPSEVSVLWGYNVEMEVKVLNPVNVGTKTKPVASMVLQLNTKVSTLIKSFESRYLYQFRGDSSEAKPLQ